MIHGLTVRECVKCSNRINYSGILDDVFIHCQGKLSKIFDSESLKYTEWSNFGQKNSGSYYSIIRV